MILSIGLENGMEGRTLAYALDFPGCFSYGAEPGEAIVAMPQVFLKYRDWIANRTPDSWLANLGDFDIRLLETWQTYQVNAAFESVASGGIEINAWFRHDWKPLNQEDVRRALALLSWSRADLLAAVAGLAAEQLDAPHPGERWSIRGILGHVALAEWWYLDRLGLTGGLVRPSRDDDPFEKLAAVRQVLLQVLPQLTGSRQVVGVSGEFWSPRKLLRRALWHERDHTGHIYQLLLP